LPHEVLVLFAERADARALAPLLSAYQARGLSVSQRSTLPASEAELERVIAADDARAVLMVGRRSRAPRTVLAGPWVETSSGRRVPVGWLPAVDGPSLGRFATAAAELHARAGDVPSVALLAQRHPRFSRLARRIATLLSDRPVLRWSAEDVTPEDLLLGLRSGLGAAVYVGHGRPVGWAGYYGVRAHHFDGFSGAPTGAVLSLCCRTASRRNTGLSFAEALPLRGVCGAVFAAVDDTLHTDNTRWAVRLCDALLAGARDLGELVTRAAPIGSRSARSYRILGDPLAPLWAPRSGLERAQQIKVWQ
jgi:hypothetical protein